MYKYKANGFRHIIIILAILLVTIGAAGIGFVILKSRSNGDSKKLVEEICSLPVKEESVSSDGESRAFVVIGGLVKLNYLDKKVNKYFVCVDFNGSTKLIRLSSNSFGSTGVGDVKISPDGDYTSVGLSGYEYSARSLFSNRTGENLLQKTNGIDKIIWSENGKHIIVVTDYNIDGGHPQIFVAQTNDNLKFKQIYNVAVYDGYGSVRNFRFIDSNIISFDIANKSSIISKTYDLESDSYK